MVNALALWHEEHVRFALLLDLLEIQVRAFHRGEQPDYQLMGDIVFYLTSFAGHVHHPREDAAFARLLAHDASLAAQTTRLGQQHRSIAIAGSQILQRLEEAVEDVMVPRAALVGAASTYLANYREHLDTEERDILPRASTLLDAQDWAAVARAVPDIADPLFGADVVARFLVLRGHLAREAATAAH
jgi:hemerythrin-like domain-containing protein